MKKRGKRQKIKILEIYVLTVRKIEMQFIQLDPDPGSFHVDKI
jgi:hypothetical protein